LLSGKSSQLKHVLAVCIEAQQYHRYQQGAQEPAQKALALVARPSGQGMAASALTAEAFVGQIPNNIFKTQLYCLAMAAFTANHTIAHNGDGLQLQC